MPKFINTSGCERYLSKYLRIFPMQSLDDLVTLIDLTVTVNNCTLCGQKAGIHDH
jgi:hypothetical protein